MSRWSEFGFPDLAGVHFQTALHGLTKALEERLFSGAIDLPGDIDILNVCENMRAYPIRWAVGDIDNMFYYLRDYVLPDGSVFTLQNAADYLQEELIDMDKRSESQWRYPWSGLKYEWCMQRYRFLNLAWKSAPGIVRTTSVYERFAGSGKTFSEAVDKLEREDFSEAAYRDIEMSLVTECGNGWCSVTRTSDLPIRLKYGPRAPGLVCVEITPRMIRDPYFDIPEDALEYSAVSGRENILQWKWDDFGCGLQINTPQIIFSQQMPADIEQGAEVDLSGLYKRLSAALKAASFSAPRPGYEYCTISRGFTANLSCFCDFRNCFEFYDPPEMQKKVFV